ncbi:MFS transporter [Inconstantimicrobium mannanitabidum]|uniref:MFS transporter n=1 Tax=Inconstantimicrobium mannanitabidum TaxID=1604901 RepID=A0ACB5R9P5_9CLOT|nr:MFS transporter [Clostridium sp. TW13]GKX65762.1 MFS transporter [Clostridium sp. TW13]
MEQAIKNNKHNADVKLSYKEKISYSSGEVGINLLFTAMGAFLLFYYTDVAGVSAAAVGSIMLISKIFDGVVDIMMGFITDRTNSKYGKARPWLLRMAIPYGIAGILLFTVPELGEVGKLIYIFITYNTFCIIYTAAVIPYYSLSSLVTQNQKERENIGFIRSIMTTVGSLAINMGTLPLVNAFGGGKTAWTITFVVFGAISAALFLLAFANTKERVGSEQENVNSKKEKRHLKDEVKYLFKNKYWLILTGNGFCSNIVMALSMGATVYFAQYILKNPAAVGILSLCSMIPMFVCIPLGYPLVRKFGKRNMLIAGLILMAVGYSIMFLGGANLMIVAAGVIVKGIGTATQWTQGPMLADTVEYGEWKNGIRQEGLIFSAQSFGTKIGSGLGSGLIGWVLGMTGYIGGVQVQSSSALIGINALFIIIPVFITVVEIVIMSIYKLDGEYSDILEQLNSRKILKH